jgi:hypothetical protein
LALEKSELALKYKPSQTQLLENHIGLVVRVFKNDGVTNENLEVFLDISKQFPAIKKLHNYKSLGAMAIVDRLEIEVDENSLTGAKKWLSKLEAFIDEVGGGVSNELLADVYKQISVMSFQKGRMSDAYKYINKALKLMPNDYALKKLKAIYAS